MSIYQLVTIFLLSLYFLDIFQFGIEKIFWQTLPTAVFATAMGALFIFLKQKKLLMPWQSLITGLIIGLVAEFGERWFILAGITLFALGLKFLVRLNGHPIFNPAGLGLILGMIIFASHPSWWAGNAILIFLVWIPILLYRLRRWAPMAAFLFPLAVFDGTAILTSGSLLFFSSVMLIEPMTSPYQIKSGLIFGLVVALVYQLSVFFNLLDPLLLGLLVGNLTKVVLDRYSKF